MAKEKVIAEKPAEDKKLIIHQIQQTNVDRTPKDVADLIHALRIAESVHVPNRSRLLDLYAVVDMDGHFTGVWSKRMAYSTRKKIAYLDASGKNVPEMDALINSRKFRDLKKLIVSQVAWGVSGAQFIPGDKFDWEEIPRKHILIERGLIKIGQNDQTGRAYEEDPFIMVYGDKRRLGLMLKVSFYALIKKGNFADWAQYSEIFGQPIRVIKYDAWDDKTRIQLQEVLNESGSSLALMIPKQTDFEIMDGKTSNGNGDLQDKLKAACNNEISLVVLGNTETSSNDNGGSNAKADVQSEGEEDLKDDDVEDMLSYLNDEKFINILRLYGYPVSEGGRFALQEHKDPARLTPLVHTIAAIRQSGTPIADDYVYDATGIPKPDNYDQLKAEKEAFKEALKPGKKAEKEAPEDLTDSVWNKVRARIADFFDHAQ